MQQLREVAHGVQRAVGDRLGLCQGLGRSARKCDRPSGDVELDADRGQRLADFVVELARDRPAFFFLRVQHLRRGLLQLAGNARVAHQLRAQARFEPAGIRAGQQQRAETNHERDADPIAALRLRRPRWISATSDCSRMNARRLIA